MAAGYRRGGVGMQMAGVRISSLDLSAIGAYWLQRDGTPLACTFTNQHRMPLWAAVAQACGAGLSEMRGGLFARSRKYAYDHMRANLGACQRSKFPRPRLCAQGKSGASF